MPRYAIGDMREKLALQIEDPALVIVSITRSGTEATVTTLVPHLRATGDYVQIAGAVATGYNGRVKITVTAARTFTYTVSSGLATPATTPGTATYATDASGGRDPEWRYFDTIAAEHVSLTATERMALQATQGVEVARFRVYARADIRTTGMRILWTPSFMRNAAQQTLGITGTPAIPGEPLWMWIDTTRRAAA